MPKHKLFTLDHFAAYTSNIVLDSGNYWQLEDFQAIIAESILKPIQGMIEGRTTGGAEVWAILPEGNAKHLAVDTQIPTPDGWTTMLELRVGDRVLNAEGEATTVRYVSPVDFGQDCYRITFSDGAQVVCSGEHLWEIEDGMSAYMPLVRSTDWLAARPSHMSKRGKDGASRVARFRVRTAARRTGPEVDLPIDPYVLGAWLGDGASASGRVTNVDQGVWDRIGEAGYQLGAIPPSVAAGSRARTQTVLGLKSELARLGLIGAKRIPDAYLVASEDDRWALLQGLMDTDGTVSKAGQVSFCTTSERLAVDVRRLAWSLGLPCFRDVDRAVMDGVDFGASYRLTVACDRRHPLFGLERKRTRLKALGRTCDHRRIIAVEPVPRVPVRCIEVDAADSLYLCGEAMIPTHNTTLMAGIGLYLTDFAPLPWIPVGACTRDQAEILAQQAYQMVRMSPGMLKRFRIYEGYKRVQPIRPGHPNPGRRGLKVLAADAGSGDGVIPFPLAICDEGHRHADMRLYRLWRGKLLKRGGCIAMISTAGVPGHEFETMRDEIRRRADSQERTGAHIQSTSKNGRVVMHEWMVQDPRWASDMDKVKEANPLSTITPDKLQEQFESPTTDMSAWMRLKPLAVDTPIPTPDGWTTMGALEVGDQILNGDGLPTKVRAVTPVRLDQGFEVAFSDGATIVAAADHEWEVVDRRGRIRVRTTAQLAQSLYVKDGRGRFYARWRVRTVGRHVGSPADLPIDPYVLGVWLGDGSNNTGHIRNGDPEVWAEIEARGYELGSLAPSLIGEPSKRMQTLLRLRPTLRALGLLNDKHVPSAYLTAAEQDRWELLQGLMDADGTVLGEGRALFWGTNARLVGDVRRLVWSLGLACMMREDRAVLYGVDHGPRFCLEMPCDARHPVVRLSRKRDRLREPRGTRFDHRRIRSIVPVGDELVRCIAVDADDSIFLAGEAYVPTHNCNIPTRAANSAISGAEWDDAEIDMTIPEGWHIGLGIDVAWMHDTFAIVPMAKMTGEHGKYRLLGTPTVLKPPKNGTMLHPDFVKTALGEFIDDYVVDEAVMDMGRAEDIAAWLEDRGVKVIAWPQGNAQASRDYEAFMSALRTGELRHSGDETLRQHVLNAMARPLPDDKRRFDRPTTNRSRRHDDQRVIDALAAASFINGYHAAPRPKLAGLVSDYRISQI